MSTKKLPSRITVEGLDRAPHRAFLHALGLKEADFQKPFVGVASTDSRITPCNALLGAFVREACAAVREAGGVPFDFASASVADSMSMNHGGMRYSLVSREIIADGVEAVARGHAYDALVTFAGCDKTLPGMMMAMVRLNLPAVFVYGGSALPGTWQGRDVTVLDTYEAVGGVLAGSFSEKDLKSLEQICIPTLGSCPGQFTANTMAMVSETLGLALPGSATLPAVSEQRQQVARDAGTAVLRILKDGGPLPRELVTKKSLENACAAVAATGGSTNAALHIPGHRARGRDPLHARGLRARRQAHAADRRHEARRALLGKGPARRRRRLLRFEELIGKRRPARRLPHLVRDHSGESARRPSRRGRRSRSQGADHGNRRPGGAERQPRARRRADQGGGAEVAGVRGTRARVRLRRELL